MRAKSAAIFAGMLTMMVLAGCGDQVPVIDTVYADELDGLSIEQIGVEVIEANGGQETDDVYVADAAGNQAE